MHPVWIIFTMFQNVLRSLCLFVLNLLLFLLWKVGKMLEGKAAKFSASFAPQLKLVGSTPEAIE